MSRFTTFANLFTIKRRVVKTDEAVIWKGSAGLYVALFMREWNAIAKELSGPMRQVTPRFNAEENCVEFFDQKETVLTKIHINDDAAGITTASIRILFPQAEKVSFIKNLPRDIKIVFFEEPKIK